MTFDQTIFFASVRKTLFRHMAQEQVDGCVAILTEAEKRELTDIHQLAYILATPWWETGQTMQPVREVGRGASKEYGTTYYGRGWPQLTWRANYEKFGKLVGIDLVNDPDAALRLDVTCKITFDGMLKGLFTGKALSEYVRGPHVDFYDARRVINGTDHASVVAQAAQHFTTALVASVRHQTSLVA